jgi:hypothetical protein
MFNAASRQARRVARAKLSIVATIGLVIGVVGFVAGPASASSQGRTIVAHINGGGTAEMTDGMGTSHWGTGVTLYSDGTASGQFDCVDQHGDAPGYAGNSWGAVTSWSTEGSVIVLNINGQFVPIPGGHPETWSFTVKIQQFGGAGVGRWTLEDKASGFIYCYELLTTGQIAIRWE